MAENNEICVRSKEVDTARVLNTQGIRYCDCYEVWGMKRTGCCGCPFNSKVHYDLEIMKKYEPTLYKACLNVFGESYRLMDEFHIRKIPILEGLEDETTK